MFASSFSVLTKYQGDQIKENEMGGACGTYGKEKRYTQGFWYRNLREKRPVGRPRS
jgi:hypothetical protein